MANQDTQLKPRTLVLCFDGTSNSYGDANTNVVKLFALLDKEQRDQQIVYYQPGIGTYEPPGTVMSGFRKKMVELVDEAVAWYLDVHVMGGYSFLMDNYKEGDRICLFGFSRGAYTARALAGMLDKVGLLPKDNTEQVEMAYDLYKQTGKSNAELAHGFRETFSRIVQIEFMGCWDTVSSVGLFWARRLPGTPGVSSVKTFRHALSLDEHRSRFQPNMWYSPSPKKTSGSKDLEQGGGLSGNDGTATDVLEVWFSGCHSDIGGGATPSNQQVTLANITLRWMIRQIAEANCGIIFNTSMLNEAGITVDEANEQVLLVQNFDRQSPLAVKKGSGKGGSSTDKLSSTSSVPSSPVYPPDIAKLDAECAIQPMDDELQKTPIWWILEIFPCSQTWRGKKGGWHTALKCNFGKGRTIATPNLNLHITVQTRMNDKALNYSPRAQWANKPDANWVV